MTAFLYHRSLIIRAGASCDSFLTTDLRPSRNFCSARGSARTENKFRASAALGFFTQTGEYRRRDVRTDVRFFLESPRLPWFPRRFGDWDDYPPGRDARVQPALVIRPQRIFRLRLHSCRA